MEKFLTLFQGISGKLSIMRVCLALIVLTTMANWTWACYNKRDIVPLPENAVTLVIGFASAKVVQRFGEKKELTTAETSGSVKS